MQPTTAPQAPAEPAAAEIARLAEVIARRRQGLVDEDDFRRLRLHHGIYGIRGQSDIQMVRVRLPAGALNAAQCERLGLAAHVPTGQVRLHVGHRPTLPSAEGSRVGG